MPTIPGNRYDEIAAGIAMLAFVAYFLGGLVVVAADGWDAFKKRWANWWGRPS